MDHSHRPSYEDDGGIRQMVQSHDGIHGDVPYDDDDRGGDDRGGDDRDDGVYLENEDRRKIMQRQLSPQQLGITNLNYFRFHRYLPFI